MKHDQRLGMMALIRTMLYVACMAVLCGPALAQEASLPERSEVARQLAALERGDQTDPQYQRQRQALDATLKALDQLAAIHQQESDLRGRITNAPAQQRRYQDQLAQINPTLIPDEDRLAHLSLPQLQQTMSGALEKLKSLQEQLGDVNQRVATAQTLPERAQSAIGRLQRDAQQMRNQLRGEEGSSASPVERTALAVRLQAADAEIALHRTELADSTVLRDLAQQERALLSKQLEAQQHLLSWLQQVIDQQRRDHSRQTIDNINETVAGPLRQDPRVKQVLEHNQSLSDALLKTTDRINSMVGDAIRVRSQLDTAQQVQGNLARQIEAMRGSVLLSRILRQQRQVLPDVDSPRQLTNEIADLRLQQFNVEQSRESLTRLDDYVNQLVASPPLLGDATKENGASDDALRAVLTPLYQSQRDLLDQLDHEYGTLLTALIDVQLNQQLLISTTTDVRNTIEEQLFWVASGRPLGWEWFKTLPGKALDELKDPEWAHMLSTFLITPSPWIFAALPLVVLVTGLSIFRRRIRAALQRLQDEVGKLRQDTQLHTPWAVLLELVLAARGPIALATVGMGLRLAGSSGGVLLGKSLIYVAMSWGYFAWAHRLLVDNGVAVRHFHWPERYVAQLRRWIAALGAVLMPTIFVVRMTQGFDLPLEDQPIALLVLMGCFLAMSFILLRLVWSHVPHVGVKPLRLVLGIIVATIPLLLVGLIIYGYGYTAIRLSTRFVTSLYILGMWVLAEAIIVRGLAVAARRLAYRRLVERRRALHRQQSGDTAGAESAAEVLEEPPLDMDQVNHQSLRLSRLALLSFFLVVLYVVWANLLNVLSYLDSVTVWDVRDGNQTVTHVTVIGLIMALMALPIAITLSRNLPGLLEVTVLSRMRLKAGNAYAITSVLSYTIMGVGIVAALGLLGLSWSKLQWLLTALGVGLGFGLQEIFANFISGLIILFERPIRIGDTITLNDLHGKVTRIRIRATTVMDFDHKEIIIPNKTFVTDRLINWSLSDSVTRVVLTFGVAHGSNLDEARRLMLQAIYEVPMILEEPAPEIFCMDYTPDAFNFEVRVYVNDVAHRLATRDALNRGVDRLFREAGIQIAYRQMDVWLHNKDGDAKLVDQRKAALFNDDKK
ncbi:mechanosensitive channel MscK [Zymobacter sp. IVIA_12111.31 C1]|uniref:mechanosensitive channel MscK n=1 Tax=Zymobacter sp. IVIA_12111.31 C1 TaxID=3394854 RepID=UPI0039C1B28A